MAVVPVNTSSRSVTNLLPASSLLKIIEENSYYFTTRISKLDDLVKCCCAIDHAINILFPQHTHSCIGSPHWRSCDLWCPNLDTFSEPEPRPWHYYPPPPPASHLLKIGEATTGGISCTATYTGSTTRALHTRAREHLYTIKSKDSSLALGEHYQLHHPNDAALVTFQILGNQWRKWNTPSYSEG